MLDSSDATRGAPVSDPLKVKSNSIPSRAITWASQAGHREWLAVAVLTIAAFFIRRANLGVQSLWFDEADLIARASGDLGSLLGSFLKPGENGPLYTFLMHFWLQFFGDSEISVRTPSLLAGTAAIPLIYLAGRKLAGGTAALIAAFILTISPYNLWHSQDAKMYELALCVTMASIWLFLEALEKNNWRWWVAYIIVTTLGFYIHVMAALVVAVEVVFYLVSLKYNRPERNSPAFINKPEKRRSWIALAIMTLPYLPIALWQLVALIDGTVGKTWFAPVSLVDMFNSLIRRFAVNRSLEPWESLGAYTFLALALAGLIFAWINRKNNLKPLFLTLYLLLPILAFYLLTTRIPLYADRYLLIASPAYYLLVSVGIVWLVRKRWSKILAGLGLALLVVTSVVAIVNVNYSKTAQKEDWREAMSQLSKWVRPGDVVIVLPGYLESAVRYYFKPVMDIPVKSIPVSIQAPKAIGDKDDIELNDHIQTVIRDFQRAWIVTSPERYRQEDPQEFIRKVWFDNNTQMFVDPQEYVGVKFYGYSFFLIPGTNTEFYPRQDFLDNVFGNNIRLEGYDMAQGGAGPGANLTPGTVKTGTFLHLTLYFRKINQDKSDYEITVRLLDKNGQDTSTTYTARPDGGYRPTNTWKVGEPVRDYREVYIKVPPGEYQVEVTMHPPGQADKPIPVTGGSGNRVILSTPVTVVD